MMNESVHLGTVRGIRVGMHWSLLVIGWLLVASLAGYEVPHAAPGHTTTAYWLAALVAAVVFYASLVAHELAHALVARRRGIEVDGIVLWLLGGVSKLRGEADRARDEERIAIVGPATSVVLALVFFGLSRLFGAVHSASLPAAVFGWLGWLNGLLALFNLVPAFPLDGGRVLRAVVWRFTGDKRRSTKIAATTGSAFGYGFIALGVAGFVFGGGSFDGLWLAVIGWFLVSASRAEANASARAGELRGLVVRDVMTPAPLTVPTWVTLDVLMREGVYRRRLSSFPVVDADDAFAGLITVSIIRTVPSERWPVTTTAAVARPAAATLTCAPHDELVGVARHLFASPDRRAVVLDGDRRVVGILSPSDLQRAPADSAVAVSAR